MKVNTPFYLLLLLCIFFACLLFNSAYNYYFIENMENIETDETDETAETDETVETDEKKKIKKPELIIKKKKERRVKTVPLN